VALPGWYLAAPGVRRVTLEQLEALVAVGRGGSLIEAARALGVPRSTLQRRIADLEASLGLPVIHRDPRGVALTDAGRRLVERSRMLLDEVELLAASVRDAYEIGGTLRLVYPVGLHPRILVAAARALSDSLPQVRFRATPGRHPGAPGEVDVALYLGPQPPPGGFVARALFRAPVRLLGAPSYLAAKGTPASLADLEAHAIWMWAPDDTAPALELLAGGALPIRARGISPDLHLLHHMAREGMGLVWVVDGGLDEGAELERLLPVLPDLLGTSVPLWLVLPEAMRDSPKIREAIETIQRLASTFWPG
jgi:DNA-binding transcriptional LysR family regulator